MKTIFKLVAVFALIFTIAGCDSGKIGEGNNKDLSDRFSKHITPEVMDETYGPVVHRGAIAKDFNIQAAKLGDRISSVSFVHRATEPNVVTLVCESRTHQWAVTHNVPGEFGAAKQATEFSIMNYPKGVKDIRSADEDNAPVFSTANGDKDIFVGLTKLEDLDPESTIAFTFEVRDAEGYSSTAGWSSLYVVKDVVKALRKADLTDCKGSTINEANTIEMSYISTADLRKLAKQQ